MDLHLRAIEAGGIIIVIFIVAYLSSFIAQYIWAWMDDSKPLKGNVLSRWVSRKVKLSKWIYPVFNGENFFGYAKDKKHDGESVYGLDKGKDYVYDWALRSCHLNYWKLCVLIASIPFLILAIVKYWIPSICIFTLVIILFVCRFTRRLNKKLKTHINDKKVHKKENESPA